MASYWGFGSTSDLLLVIGKFKVFIDMSHESFVGYHVSLSAL